MSELHLSELWRYPVKSMRGRRHARLAVEARGFRADRRWMPVGPDGGFLTQRQLPRMALINTEVTAGPRGDELVLSLDSGERCVVSADSQAQMIDVSVWGDRCLGSTLGETVDRWLSEFLQQPCRLVAFPAEQRRAVDPRYAGPDDQVGFADGFPFLLISQASLDELNERLDTPVAMQRFRPNLVVSGCEAHAEDQWQRIRIGDIQFRLAKPCSRCPIPSIDPMTAERGKEPLRTLHGYRYWDNHIWFGQNLLHDAIGVLQEGMRVEVLA